MGLMDSAKRQYEKNKDKIGPLVDKANEQFEQSKHKVSPLVEKATDQVDKVTKGKTAGVSAKANEAARKLTGTPETAGTEPKAVEELEGDDTTS
jgi:hypothetical protein